MGLFWGKKEKKQPSMQNVLDGAVMYAKMTGEEYVQVDVNIYDLQNFVSSLDVFSESRDGAFLLSGYKSKQGYGPYHISAVQDRRGGTLLAVRTEAQWRGQFKEQEEEFKQELEATLAKLRNKPGS